MSASSSRPTNKGYSPVPVEPIPERIDDGLDPQQEDADVDDDDNLYTSNAPLLSRRGRDMGAQERHAHLPWYRRMFNWRPFARSDSDMPAWAPATTKARNWRKIVLWTLLGLLISAVIILSVMTGLLADRLRHSTSRDNSCSSYRWQRRSHLLLKPYSYSYNYGVDIVNIYPPLRPTPNYECRAAWTELRWINCHEKVLNRGWDNGKVSSIFDPDISLYADPMCAPVCRNVINSAYQTIRSKCTETDKFDLDNYHGTFSLDAKLEDNPVDAIKTLDNRLMHHCRVDPSQPSSQWRPAPMCVQIMWEDWHIVDGMNAGHLEGIDNFLKQTNSYGQKGRRVRYWSQTDTCDNTENWNHRSLTTQERYVGPAVNSTTCGWCTMDWFERKLLGWKKDEVRDPKTGELVDLTDYLTRIKEAGQRCEADAWERAWNRALKKYKTDGQLDRDWPGKDGKKPCKEDQGTQEDDVSYYPYE